MFRRILVPLDGSPDAEQALPVAARLARASAGTVVLLRIVNPLSELAPYYPSDSEIVRGMVEAEEAATRNYLGGVTYGAQLNGVQTETTVLFGQPATMILSEVQARHIDLVVMRSHGYTGMKRWMLGSVAEKIARHAPVPLLILREERSFALAPGTQADRTICALVPLESSVSAKSALAPAARLVAALAAPARGALHLVQVVVPPSGLESSQSECNALMRKAQRFLESIVEDLHHGLITPQVAEFHLSLSCSVTLDDDIAAGIARLAEEGADVIVMAPHEFYGMPQWAVSSITERVLHTSRLPLFIVPR